MMMTIDVFNNNDGMKLTPKRSQVSHKAEVYFFKYKPLSINPHNKVASHSVDISKELAC